MPSLYNYVRIGDLKFKFTYKSDSMIKVRRILKFLNNKV